MALFISPFPIPEFFREEDEDTILHHLGINRAGFSTGTDVINLTKILNVLRAQDERAQLPIDPLQVALLDHPPGCFIDDPHGDRIKIEQADFPRIPSLLQPLFNRRERKGLPRPTAYPCPSMWEWKNTRFLSCVIAHSFGLINPLMIVCLSVHNNYYRTLHLLCILHQNSVLVTLFCPGRNRMSPIISATCPTVYPNAME